MQKIHTHETLMNKSKKELVEHIICLEHNLNAVKINFENQYKNCLRIVEDMNILNDTFKKGTRRTSQ